MMRRLLHQSRQAAEHRGRYRCAVCGYRTTRYSFGWTTKNPLSPAQLRRIAEAKVEREPSG
jgi:hypothetical protein